MAPLAGAGMDGAAGMVRTGNGYDNVGARDAPNSSDGSAA
jgi:hypothetical protein